MIIIFEEKDINGILVPINNSQLPFDIKRIFYIYNTPYNVIRGNHGNRYTSEILICLNGNCEVTIDNYAEKKIFFLDKKNIGLYIKPYNWITFKCSGDSILLVICDTEFSQNDRISNYDDIINHHTNNTNK
jgi:hypothetical protein